MTNDISFDENKYVIKSRVILGQPENPAMIKYLLNKGLVKNEKTAHILLISVTTLFLLLAVYVFAAYVFGFSFTNKTTLTPEQVQRMEEYRERLKQSRDRAVQNQNNNQ